MAPRPVPEIFAKHPETARAFSELMAFVDTLTSCTIEEKKTCLHVVAGKAAFLGVHPRKNGLRLTVVLSRPIDSPRIVKCEKASAKRYHVDLNILASEGIDNEVRSWITEAYQRNIQVVSQ